MLPSSMIRPRPTFQRLAFSASPSPLPSTSGHCLSACSFAPPPSVGCQLSAASSPVSPFAATLMRRPQITEKPATLTPAFAALTSRVRHNPCVCHSYKKHPGVGYALPFRSPNDKSCGPGADLSRHSSLTTRHFLSPAKPLRINTYATARNCCI